MVYIIYGALGALCGLVICSVCFWLGWRTQAKATARVRQTDTREIGEQERALLIEQQQAFRSMMNYSPEIAYGLEPAEPELGPNSNSNAVRG